MKPSLKALFLFGSLGVAVAISTVLFSSSPDVVEAAGDEHRVFMGYNQNSIYVTGDWHNTGNRAIDFGKIGDPWGYAVNYRSEEVSGGSTMIGYKFSLGAGTTCTGWKVNVYGDGFARAKVRYVHIVPYAGVPSLWTVASSGVTSQYLGYLAGSQVTSCPWSAPHLHQMDELSSAAKNTSLNANEPYNYGDSDSWMFKLTW